MLTKLFAWLAVSLGLLFVALSIAGLFLWDSADPDGGFGATLFWFGGIPMLVLSVLMGVTLLVLAAFESDTESDPESES
jgi:hypothetical protein